MNFLKEEPKVSQTNEYKNINPIRMMRFHHSAVGKWPYVQSHMGVSLSQIFLQAKDASWISAEEVSNKHTQRMLKEIIHAEEKNNPLSDDCLAQMLNEEADFTLQEEL